MKLTKLLRMYAGVEIDGTAPRALQVDSLESPEALVEAYEERMAIMEFEGGLSREEAERLTLEYFERKMRVKHDTD